MDCNDANFVMLQKLNLVNGVLFTGGRAKRGLYVEVVESIFKVHIILFVLVILIISVAITYLFLVNFMENERAILVYIFWLLHLVMKNLY